MYLAVALVLTNGKLSGIEMSESLPQCLFLSKSQAKEKNL